jgi:hypothetical protein
VGINCPIGPGSCRCRTLTIEVGLIEQDESVGERKVPDLDTSIFIVPGDRVKNTEDRLFARPHHR